MSKKMVCGGCCEYKGGVVSVVYSVSVMRGRSEKVSASWCARCRRIARSGGSSVVEVAR